MKLVWYNRPRKFPNGIVWVRLGDNGPGLWWKDTRVASPARAMGNPRAFRVGPYRVCLLKRQSP